jgi:hypothetical protein
MGSWSIVFTAMMVVKDEKEGEEEDEEEEEEEEKGEGKRCNYSDLRGKHTYRCIWTGMKSFDFRV